MKTTEVKWAFLLLLVFGFTSCRDDLDEINHAKGIIETRSLSSEEVIDYYWCMGEKNPIKRVVDKTYVLFKSENREKFLFSLAKAKIWVNPSQIKEYKYGGTDLSGKQSKDYLITCGWTWLSAIGRRTLFPKWSMPLHIIMGIAMMIPIR